MPISQNYAVYYVVTAWPVLGLRMEGPVSRFGGFLQIH